jgi:hypothetical protein
MQHKRRLLFLFIAKVLVSLALGLVLTKWSWNSAWFGPVIWGPGSSVARLIFPNQGLHDAEAANIFTVSLLFTWLLCSVSISLLWPLLGLLRAKFKGTGMAGGGGVKA